MKSVTTNGCIAIFIKNSPLGMKMDYDNWGPEMAAIPNAMDPLVTLIWKFKVIDVELFDQWYFSSIWSSLYAGP